MPSTLALEGAHFYVPKDCTKMYIEAHQKNERWTAVNTDPFVARKGGFRDWCRSTDLLLSETRYVQNWEHFQTVLGIWHWHDKGACNRWTHLIIQCLLQKHWSGVAWKMRNKGTGSLPQIVWETTLFSICFLFLSIFFKLGVLSTKNKPWSERQVLLHDSAEKM